MGSRWARIVRPRAEYEKRLPARLPYTASCGRAKAERIFILPALASALALALAAEVGRVVVLVSWTGV